MHSSEKSKEFENADVRASYIGALSFPGLAFSISSYTDRLNTTVIPPQAHETVVVCLFEFQLLRSAWGANRKQMYLTSVGPFFQGFSSL